MKQGQILSETTFYTIKSVKQDAVVCTTSTGQDVQLHSTYVEKLCNNSSEYNKEEKLNQTELIKKIVANPKVAMTVVFQKADTKKTKKAYNEELKSKAEEVKNNFMANGVFVLEEALKAFVLEIIPGEMRTMLGYSTGEYNDNGFLQFVDAEDDYRLKQVNPRGITEVIIKGVKYIKK